MSSGPAYQPLLPLEPGWWELRTRHDAQLVRALCSPRNIGQTDYQLLSSEVDACWTGGVDGDRYQHG